MIFWTFQQTERTTGGGPISWVSDFIAYKETSFGEAINRLEVTVFSNPEPIKISNRPVSKSQERGFGQARDVKLPSVVYRKKEKKLRIKWRSQHLTEDEMEIFGYQNATTSVFIRAVHDVHDALNWGLNERLSARDDFDISGCLGWVKEAQTQAPKKDGDLRSILFDRSKLYLHLVRTNHFHNEIDVDWSSMHKNAAHLLYHYDLWNETDARMPHGNVFGKGILEHFDYYEKMPLAEILSSLGMVSYNSATTYDEKIKSLQVELAFVFAYIKKRGKVPERLADELVGRMVEEAKNDRSFWVHRSRHGIGSHFAWMFNYLEAFSTIERPAFLKGES